MFQSTRPHGARQQVAAQQATHSQGFNPRARTGRDPFRLPVNCFTAQFQSTRPHGARRKGSQAAGATCCFNPRARTGRDPRHARDRVGLVEFQSTRPHGARRIRMAASLLVERFNPRARTGRDSATTGAISTISTVSIHAPARGATDGQ